MIILTKDSLHTLLARELGERKIHPDAIAQINTVLSATAPYVDKTIVNHPIWVEVSIQVIAEPVALFAGAVTENGILRPASPPSGEVIRQDLEGMDPESAKATALLSEWVAEFMFAHIA